MQLGRGVTAARPPACQASSQVLSGGRVTDVSSRHHVSFKNGIIDRFNHHFTPNRSCRSPRGRLGPSLPCAGGTSRKRMTRRSRTLYPRKCELPLASVQRFVVQLRVSLPSLHGGASFGPLPAPRGPSWAAFYSATVVICEVPQGKNAAQFHTAGQRLQYYGPAHDCPVLNFCLEVVGLQAGPWWVLARCHASVRQRIRAAKSTGTHQTSKHKEGTAGLKSTRRVWLATHECFSSLYVLYLKQLWLGSTSPASPSDCCAWRSPAAAPMQRRLSEGSGSVCGSTLSHAACRMLCRKASHHHHHHDHGMCSQCESAAYGAGWPAIFDCNTCWPRLRTRSLRSIRRGWGSYAGRDEDEYRLIR
jgi:hypothetical protein